MRVPSILLSLLVLSACGLPPAVTIAGLAIDGVSFLTSGKSMGDHALSALTQRDCAVLRVLAEQDVKALCQPKEEAAAVAESEQAEPTAVAAVRGPSAPAPEPAATPGPLLVY